MVGMGLSAVRVCFFSAYIGFDAVSTAAQEARHPQRDMPVAIIGSVLICTMIYILVAGIATGVVPYRELNVPNPIGVVADRAGLGWMALLIKFGAIAGLSSVILVLLLGQSRVAYSLGRDGLLPPFAYRTHSRYGTPHISSFVLGALVAVAAAVVPLHDAATLVSIGTLFAFFVVSIALIFLRYQQPDLPRPFRTPFIFAVAPLSAAATLYLMVALGLRPWLRLCAWGAIGFVLYFLYGAKHSVLARDSRGGV